jgi:hypothetical protein
MSKNNQQNMLELHSYNKKKFSTNDNIDELKEKLNTYKNILIKTDEIKNEITELNERINNYEKNMHNENIYIYSTHNILESYYDLDKSNSSKKVDINQYFSRKSNDDTITKKKLLKEYTYVTENILPEYNNNIMICNKCDIELILSKNSDFYICLYCGHIENVIVISEASNNLTDFYTKSSVYQRKNHFKEWLTQIQAKENIDISQHIIDEILIEIHKMNITDLSNLNSNMIKKILKKINYTKYYENVHYIMYTINGLKPPYLSPKEEKQLLYYFKQIEEPFILYKKKGRKNILRYSYILYKLCELMELDEFLPHFSLLKNREKLMEQDKIWKAICTYLEWEYIPSI